MLIDIFYDDAAKSTKFTLLEEVTAVFGKELHFIPKRICVRSDAVSHPGCGGIVMQ